MVQVVNGRHVGVCILVFHYGLAQLYCSCPHLQGIGTIKCFVCFVCFVYVAVVTTSCSHPCQCSHLEQQEISFYGVVRLLSFVTTHHKFSHLLILKQLNDEHSHREGTCRGIQVSALFTTS